MAYIDFLKGLFPDSYNVNGEVYRALFGAIGAVLDIIDPYAIIPNAAIPGVCSQVQFNLSNLFSVTTSYGPDLDCHGADWGVKRRLSESDTDYKKRILAALPIYSMGPTVSGIANAVAPFTGTAPIVYETGVNGFVVLDSAIYDAPLVNYPDLFTFVVTVLNPNNVSYSHYDMENAVRNIKLARSIAIIYHNGIDTSTLNEPADATVTII